MKRKCFRSIIAFAKKGKKKKKILCFINAINYVLASLVLEMGKCDHNSQDIHEEIKCFVFLREWEYSFTFELQPQLQFQNTRTVPV